MPSDALAASILMKPVCPSCRSTLSRGEAGLFCDNCSQTYPFADNGIPDLRLTSARTTEGFNQEPIWDRLSEGAPTTPVDGLECRNDLKSILFRKLSDRIGWPGADSMTIDLGCFDGSLSRNWTLRYGTSIVGVDASLQAIRRARRADPFANEYHLATLEALPFSDRTFDAALCLDVLEHTGDPAPAVREAARVMKPGAPFLFYVVSSRAKGTWDWFRHQARRLTGMPIPVRFGDDPEGGHRAENLVAPETFCRLCDDAGLRLDGLHPFHAFFTAFVDDVLRPWIVRRRAGSGAAEAPAAVAPEANRQTVLKPEGISGAKRTRLRRVEQVFALAEFLDTPWRAAGIGRGFAAWGRRHG